MQPEICNEKTNQISFILHKGKLPQTAENNQSKRTLNISQPMSLAQIPEEKFTLKFSLNYSHNSYDYNYGRSRSQFEYQFTLTFQNNLHDVSNNYGYEIEVYQCVKDTGNQNMSYHVLVFSQKQIRETNEISIKNTFNSHSNNQSIPAPFNAFLIDNDERHICCRIRRYNVKKTNAGIDVQSAKTINVGAMLLESALYSNVSLIAGEANFKVHKEILSSASNVFKIMFSHDMVENEKNTVTIDDFDSKVVEGLLEFLYTGKTSLLSKMPIELFEIAHKYEVRNLMAQCIESFLFLVNKNNVVDILDTAHVYDLTDLKQDLWKFIHNHEEEMVKEESFQQFLCRQLKNDTVVNTLKLCDKYKASLKKVELETFKFIKIHNKSLVSDGKFLGLFGTHSSLMKRLYVFIHKNE